LNCDSVFIGAAGVSEEKGLTEYNLEDTEIKLAAIRSGRRVIVLADASKMGQVAFVNLTPLSDIDLLVTNASPNDRTVQAARELGVEIFTSSPSRTSSPRSVRSVYVAKRPRPDHALSL